jgi:ABC-2 type transport system ATP-binding protein
VERTLAKVTVDAVESTEAEATEDPALVATDVVKSWSDENPPVLAGVGLRVDRGTTVAIAGRNGAGKTTLLRIIAGMITADAGSIRVCGLDPERQRTDFQRRVGFLAAGNSGLYARLKAEQHLDLWARLALMPRPNRRAAIERTIEQFGLGPLCGRRVDRLSMGQRQRLRLALAFVHDPALVLLDEPATSLDEPGIGALQAALDGLKGRGGAALVCLPSGWRDVLTLDGAYTLEDGRLKPDEAA